MFRTSGHGFHLGILKHVGKIGRVDTGSDAFSLYRGDPASFGQANGRHVMIQNMDLALAVPDPAESYDEGGTIRCTSDALEDEERSENGSILDEPIGKHLI